MKPIKNLLHIEAGYFFLNRHGDSICSTVCCCFSDKESAISFFEELEKLANRGFRLTHPDWCSFDKPYKVKLEDSTHDNNGKKIIEFLQQHFILPMQLMVLHTRDPKSKGDICESDLVKKTISMRSIHLLELTAEQFANTTNIEEIFSRVNQPFSLGLHDVNQVSHMLESIRDDKATLALMVSHQTANMMDPTQGVKVTDLTKAILMLEKIVTRENLLVNAIAFHKINLTPDLNKRRQEYALNAFFAPSTTNEIAVKETRKQ